MPKENDDILMSFTPEIALLIACLRSNLQENQDDDISVVGKLAKEIIDWSLVVQTAADHKVIPLVQKALFSQFNSVIPDDVLAKLNTLQSRKSFHCLAVSSALINVTSLLNKHGIDVLPIKGPLLAERLFGACNMRTYGDLDILVRKNDIQKTLNILLENDFTLQPEGIPRSTYDRFMKHAYHGRLLDPNGVIIELHWELTGFYVSHGITFETVEPYLIKTVFQGHPSLDLTAEMLFLYLCIHGIKHRFEKLDYICSIVELLKSAPDMDWALIFKLSEKYKIKKGIVLALTVTEKLFDIQKCRKLEEIAASAPELAEFADKIIEWNFGTGKGNITHPLQKNTGYQLAVFDDRLELFKFLFRSKFIPHHGEWSRMKYPNFLFYLYFINITCRVFSFSTNNRLNIILKKIKKNLQIHN